MNTLEQGNEIEQEVPGSNDESLLDIIKEGASSEEPIEEKVEELPEAPAVPAFAPDFKLTAFGKEYEIPEKFRALVTDESSQKEIKDIFERAYGIDGIKEKNTKYKEEIDYVKSEVLPKYAKQDEIIEELANYVKRDDWVSYFEKLNVPLERVKAAINLIENLSPQEAQLYNQNRELQKQVFQVQSEKQMTTAQLAQIEKEKEDQVIQKFDYDISQVLGKSEFSNAVKSYDESHGEGSFKQKVIKYAAFIEQSEGKTLPFEHAAKEVMQMIPQQMVAPKTVMGNTNKPVLPVVNSKPMSATSKPIMSIQQLRQVAQESANS